MAITTQTPSATIAVKFTNPGELEGANAVLSAEVDSRTNGLNAGKSSFIPGEVVRILVYKSDNVNLISAESTAGSVTAEGTALVEKTEELQFVHTDSAELSVPAERILTSTWYGQSLGDLVLAPDKKTVRVPQKGLGLLSITYEARATIGALVSPTSVNGAVDFSILVLITGEIVTV